MIRAEFTDGAWRVVDDHGRRYLPSAIYEHRSIGGSFTAQNTATIEGWDESTKLTEREALLLAGALRVLDAERMERERRATARAEAVTNVLRSDLLSDTDVFGDAWSASVMLPDRWKAKGGVVSINMPTESGEPGQGVLDARRALYLGVFLIDAAAGASDPVRMAWDEAWRLGELQEQARTAALIAAARGVLEMRDATNGNGGRLTQRPCLSGSCKGTVCAPAAELQARFDALIAEVVVRSTPSDNAVLVRALLERAGVRVVEQIWKTDVGPIAKLFTSKSMCDIHILWIEHNEQTLSESMVPPEEVSALVRAMSNAKRLADVWRALRQAGKTTGRKPVSDMGGCDT
jgi:hypothetical protein